MNMGFLRLGWVLGDFSLLINRALRLEFWLPEYVKKNLTLSMGLLCDLLSRARDLPSDSLLLWRSLGAHCERSSVKPPFRFPLERSVNAMRLRVIFLVIDAKMITKEVPICPIIQYCLLLLRFHPGMSNWLIASRQF